MIIIFFCRCRQVLLWSTFPLINHGVHLKVFHTMLVGVLDMGHLIPSTCHLLGSNLTITIHHLICPHLWRNSRIMAYQLMEEKLQWVFIHHQMLNLHHQWSRRLFLCFYLLKIKLVTYSKLFFLVVAILMWHAAY